MIPGLLAAPRLRIPPVCGWIVAALVAFLAAALAVPAQADWTVVWKVWTVSPAPDEDPHPVTVLLKGDWARLERSATAVVLVDGASGRIYELDSTAKTYTVMVPGAPSVALPMGALPPGVVPPRLVEEVSGTLRPESETKTVAGRPTRRYAAASKMSMTMPSSPQERMPSFETEGDVWVGEGDQPAPRAMAAVLPLVLGEKPEPSRRQEKMDRRMERMMGVDIASVRKMGSMGTSMASLLRPVTEQLAALGGPVLAARLSYSLGPGFPAIDFVAEATSVAETTHDVGLFAVPADYRRVGGDAGTVAEEPSGPVVPVTATVASFDRLVGVYSLPHGEIAVTREGDRLFVESAAGSREELVPAEGTRFRIGRQPGEMSFFQDAAGRVTHAMIVTQGMEMRAPRVR